jgi:recombination protein RecT
MNQVATKEPNPIATLKEAMDNGTEQFRAALPAHIPVERFKRVLLTAVQNNTALATADRRTFFNSSMKCAQDGLLPDGREAALVIYNTKVKVQGKDVWVPMVQYMPMIAGLRKKVRNSGEIATWDAKVVYEKDEFDFAEGLDPYLKHKPFIDGDPGKVRAAYSVARLKSGETTFEVMSVHQIERIRALSKSKDGPAWKDHYGEMCRKTVARRHSKVLPMSTDLDDLIRRDDDLYDMDGASDKAQLPAERRPQLADFSALPENDISTEDPKSATAKDAEQSKAEPTAATVGSASTAEAVDQETGEVTEIGPPEAMEIGRQRRKDNLPRRAPDGMEGPMADAFLAGWDEIDDELQQAAKGGGK